MQEMTLGEVEDASIKVFDNAKELTFEALMLADNQHFSRAYSLAHLACEELSKLSFFLGVGIDLARGRTIDWKKLDSTLRDHLKKIQCDLAVDYALGGKIEKADDFNESKFRAEVATRNQRKNLSLYCDWVNGKFVKPSESVGRNDAISMIQFASSQLKRYGRFPTLKHGELIKMVKEPGFEEVAKIYLDRKSDERS